MPRYSYLDFTVLSEDMNVPGSSDVTKPSEGWGGDDVNDALRATNSALRNLGDAAAKLPLDNQGPNNGRVGTAAFQNVESFQISGGVLGPNVRGSIGGSVLIMVLCAVADINSVYAEQRTRGFDLCDGRRTTDPYPPFAREVTMPNLLGCFPFFTDGLINVGQFKFGAVPGLSEGATQSASISNRTITVDNHSHGNTGATGLGYNELPNVVTAVSAPLDPSGGLASGNERLLTPVIQGSGGTNGAGHIHSTGLGGMHVIGTDDNPLNIRPPAIALIPFLRVW